MKLIVHVIFMGQLYLISTQNGGSPQHQKEFDYPALYFNKALQKKSSNDDQSPFKPLVELKKAMGPLPARLPPIYYPYNYRDHGPYEGDSRIVFQQPQQTAGLLMAESYQHVDTSQLPMAGHPRPQQHLGPPETRLGPPGSHVMPQHPPPKHLADKPESGPPEKPPLIDYTEENIWLTGGLYLAALILRSLGEDVQFQGPVIGRRKRQGNWTFNAVMDPVLVESGLIDSTESTDSGEMCLELAACLQPHWAQFYIDNLRKITNGQKLKAVLSRIESGMNINKEMCRQTFKCHQTNFPTEYFE